MALGVSKWAVRWGASCVLLTLGLYCAWPVEVLRVSSAAQPRRHVLAASLNGIKSVGIGFTHSFYQVPQEERYILRDGSLKLAKVFFGSHDALDYYDPLSVHHHQEVPGGYEILMAPPLELPISYAMGGQTDIWLRLGPGRKIDLNRLLPHGDGFSLSVVRRPRILTKVLEWLRG